MSPSDGRRSNSSSKVYLDLFFIPRGAGPAAERSSRVTSRSRVWDSMQSLLGGAELSLGRSGRPPVFRGGRLFQGAKELLPEDLMERPRARRADGWGLG